MEAVPTTHIVARAAALRLMAGQTLTVIQAMSGHLVMHTVHLILTLIP